ncbi:hypothetical protein F4703DRAFT_1834783 [Phycomyces blakesleeanus]
MGCENHNILLVISYCSINNLLLIKANNLPKDVITNIHQPISPRKIRVAYACLYIKIALTIASELSKFSKNLSSKPSFVKFESNILHVLPIVYCISYSIYHLRRFKKAAIMMFSLVIF